MNAAAFTSTDRVHTSMAQVASADVWRQELESTSSMQHVVPVAACGLWALAELIRSYGRPAACRTRWQTLQWVRTTESEQSCLNHVCNTPTMRIFLNDRTTSVALFSDSVSTKCVPGNHRPDIAHTAVCNTNGNCKFRTEPKKMCGLTIGSRLTTVVEHVSSVKLTNLFHSL